MLRPRAQSFKNHGHRLEDHKADVIVAFFGFNESFGGQRGLAKFEQNLEKFITDTLAAKYNGASPPQLVLFSSVAHEDIHRRGYPNGAENNTNIALYTESMKKIAAKHKVPLVDLFGPSQKLMAEAGGADGK